MPSFARLASLAVLLVAASRGSGQAIQPREIVLPYQADVQNHLASAVVQEDGSWLASGRADAALNITFEQNGDVRQIEHVRAPFIADFDYGFPVGSRWYREVSGQLVHFDNLQNINEDGLYDSGCRIRVALPSQIDFYSAACGDIGITGENSYLWFRNNYSVSRLIRRVDGVELWNLRLYDIPNYGRFSGAGAVYSSDSALVYGNSTLAGPIAMKIGHDGNTQWIRAFPSPSGGFAQGQFAEASFDPILQQFVFWFNETDESVLPPRLSSRMYWLSPSGQIQRSNTAVPRPLSFAGTSAIVLQDAPARLERIDGEFGTVLWSQPTATPLTAVCNDRSAIYLSTAPAQPSPGQTATIEKFQIADGAVAYRQTVASAGPVQSLFCDQGQAFLQAAAIDEPRIAPMLTKFSAQGLVQWQRPFPPVPHEVSDVRLASNQHGDMVVELGLNRNYVALPVRYQLSHELVRGYTQAGDRFEVLLPSSTVLGNGGSLSHVAVSDTDKKGFDYRFEQLDAQGNLRWQVASPYKSQMRVAQSNDGVAWFSPERASTEFGFPVYSVTPQGLLRTDQMQGDSIGDWVNVGNAIEAVVNDGAAVKVVRMVAGAAPSYELIPGFVGETRVSTVGDVFALSQPTQFPVATTVKKYERLSHQFVWELAANTELSELVPDATGGVWAKAVGHDPEPFISAAHINANGQLLSASNFSTRIIFENQVCAITELRPVGTGALGFGSIIGGGCVFWLDARGVVVDGALLPGTLIKQIAYSTPKPEVINVLAQRQNAQGLFEVVVQAVQRGNFRDGFD